MGSVVLPHLVTGWHVDQAIMSEEERLVVIRFGRDWDPDCMRQDEVLYRKHIVRPYCYSQLVQYPAPTSYSKQVHSRARNAANSFALQVSPTVSKTLP